MKLRLFPAMATVLVLAFMLRLPSPAAAAYSVFLQLPGVDGESTDSQHPKWIEVLGVGEAVTNPSTGATGVGTAQFSDISIIKALDKTSPLLFIAAASAHQYPNATVDFVEAGADRRLFFKIKLTNVLITAVRNNATPSGAGNRPTESVSLHFDKIEWDYFPLTATGEPGAPVVGTWDVTKSAPQ